MTKCLLCKGRFPGYCAIERANSDFYAMVYRSGGQILSENSTCVRVCVYFHAKVCLHVGPQKRIIVNEKDMLKGNVKI